jgi:hypothetical protein
MELQAYTDYFLDIATRLKEIGHTEARKRFTRFNIEEVFSGLRSTLDLNNFCLCLESFEGNLGANNYDQVFDNNTCAFMIVKNCGNDNFVMETQICDQAKVIGMKVVAKMAFDAERRQRGLAPVALKNFDINSVQYEKVGPIFDNCFGYRFTFQVYDSLPLVYNPDDFLPE